VYEMANKTKADQRKVSRPYAVSNLHMAQRIDELDFLEMRRQGVTNFSKKGLIKGDRNGKAISLNLTPYVEELNSLYRGPLDFSGANLRGLYARGIILSGSNFDLADLEGADLRKADLSNCRFCVTRLGYVNFSSANLSGTYFSTARATGFLCLEGIKEDEYPEDIEEFKRANRGIDYTLEGYEKYAQERERMGQRAEKYANNPRRKHPK